MLSSSLPRRDRRKPATARVPSSAAAVAEATKVSASRVRKCRLGKQSGQHAHQDGSGKPCQSFGAVDQRVRRGQQRRIRQLDRAGSPGPPAATRWRRPPGRRRPRPAARVRARPWPPTPRRRIEAPRCGPDQPRSRRGADPSDRPNGRRSTWPPPCTPPARRSDTPPRRPESRPRSRSAPRCTAGRRWPRGPARSRAAPPGGGAAAGSGARGADYCTRFFGVLPSSTAWMPSSTSMPMASRVSVVALPRCGSSTTFSNAM